MKQLMRMFFVLSSIFLIATQDDEKPLSNSSAPFMQEEYAWVKKENGWQQFPIPLIPHTPTQEERINAALPKKLSALQVAQLILDHKKKKLTEELDRTEKELLQLNLHERRFKNALDLD